MTAAPGWRRYSPAQALARTGAQLGLALLAAWMLARLGIRWDYVADSPAQIGRASCRERVFRTV